MKFTLITAKCLAMFAGCLLAIANSHAEQVEWASVGISPSSRGGDMSLAIGTAKENWGVELGFISDNWLNLSDDPELLPSGHTVRHVGNSTDAIGVDAVFQITVGSFRPYVGIGAYYADSWEVVYSNTDGKYYKRLVDSSFSFGREIGVKMTAGSFLFGLGYHTLRGGNISIGNSF